MEKNKNFFIITTVRFKFNKYIKNLKKIINELLRCYFMAEMLQDLLNSIYQRIAQLGQSIQGLKTSLDELNQNIEEKITNLGGRISEFSNEIKLTQTKHIETIKEIGMEATNNLNVIQEGLALDSFQNIVSNLENFEKLAQEVLNQDTVNLLLSEAIDSVKSLKESVKEEEIAE